MADEYPVKKIHNTEGTKCVSIMARADGRYRFVEDSLSTQDGYSFWTPTHWSGIYETAEAAERDAIITLPWARDENAN